MASQNFNL